MKVEAVVGGAVCLTVIDGEGEAIEVYLDRREAQGLREDIDSAIDVAAALVAQEQGENQHG